MVHVWTQKQPMDMLEQLYNSVLCTTHLVGQGVVAYDGEPGLSSVKREYGKWKALTFLSQPQIILPMDRPMPRY